MCRLARYVAQENLVAIESKADRKIAHDLLPHVFEGFDDERAAYRPVQQLRVWYPADDLAPPAAQPELQQQRLDGVVRAMAALRSLLRAHALDARREGLLPPALLLLAAAPSAADARVLERGCAAALPAPPHSHCESGRLRRSRRRNATSLALQPHARSPARTPTPPNRRLSPPGALRCSRRMRARPSRSTRRAPRRRRGGATPRRRCAT